MSEDTGKRDDQRDEARDPSDDLDEHLFDEAEFEAEGWSIPRDPESVARVLKSLESLVPDIFRRTTHEGQAGEEGDGPSGAESLRDRLSDRKLPREAVSFILGQVDTTKREFLRILSREIRLFLQDMDLGGELAKILTSLSFEVKMEVRFIPNDQAFKPSARGRMRIKRKRAKGDEDSAAAEDDDAEQTEGNGDDDVEPSGDDEQSKRRRWSLRRRAKDDDARDEERDEDPDESERDEDERDED